LLASVTLSLIFLGPLWSRLQRGTEWLAVVGVAGGVVGAAFLLETAMFTIAAAVTGDVGDGHTARTLLILGYKSARAVVAPALATVAAATIAGFRYNVFPSWFSALSLGFSLLLLIALLPIGPAGLLGQRVGSGLSSHRCGSRSARTSERSSAVALLVLPHLTVNALEPVSLVRTTAARSTQARPNKPP
jgi:hypothetical protein